MTNSNCGHQTFLCSGNDGIHNYSNLQSQDLVFLLQVFCYHLCKICNHVIPEVSQLQTAHSRNLWRCAITGDRAAEARRYPLISMYCQRINMSVAINPLLFPGSLHQQEQRYVQFIVFRHFNYIYIYIHIHTVGSRFTTGLRSRIVVKRVLFQWFKLRYVHGPNKLVK